MATGGHAPGCDHWHAGAARCIDHLRHDRESADVAGMARRIETLGDDDIGAGFDLALGLTRFAHQAPDLDAKFVRALQKKGR